MKEVNDNFKNIMDELEKNIKNPEDLEYIKSKFSNLFLEVLNNMATKMENLEAKQEELEDSINRIEKELFIEDDFSFEIVCPYCNAEFVVDYDDLKDEIQCPECNNVIELDWGDDCEEHGGCCGHDCSHCDEEDM